MGTKMTTASLFSVFDGRRCAGFLLHRGPAGWEAFTADEISLGVFATRQDAANAIPLQEAPPVPPVKTATS
jgi:hypothetical protein